MAAMPLPSDRPFDLDVSGAVEQTSHDDAVELDYVHG
jgi:hypothetical protein